jgi:hypothetical protein
MAVGLGTFLIHLYARVGESPVLNELGTVEVLTSVRDIRPGDNGAVDATVVVESLDIPALLREFADRLEAEPANPADVNAADIGLPTGLP